MLSNAQVEFSLRPLAIEVKTLRWSSQGSNFVAHGSVKNFADPKVELAYRALLDLQQAGDVLQLPTLRGGTVEVDGEGRYNLNDFASSGKMLVRNLHYQDATVDVAGVHGGTDFSVTPKQIAFSKLQLRVFGGSISGAASVLDWSTRPGEPGKTPQTGSGHFKVDGVQVASAIQALAHNMAAAKLVGTAEGTVDAAWNGTAARAHASIAVDVAPPARPAQDAIPVTAVLRAEYDLASAAMQVQQLSLATRATRLNAAGTLGGTKSRFNLSVNTTDLREFQPALAAIGSGPIPVSLEGRASFNGTVVGTTKQPRLVGHIEIDDFDSVVARATKMGTSGMSNVSVPRPVRLHWDSVVADIDVSPSQFAAHQGVLQRGSSRIHFDGSTTLTKFKFNDASRFLLALDLSNATVAEVQSLAGYSYPIDGVLNLRARLAGTTNDLKGDGEVRINNGTAYGEAFQSLNADVHLAQQEVHVSRLTLSRSAGGSQLAGNG